MRTSWVIAVVVAAGCGDDGGDPTFNESGGTIDVPGCDYSLTTRYGAEAPRVSGDQIGVDPTPRWVHLGIAGKPTTSIVAQWRTADEMTTETLIRYGVGANLPADQLTKTVKGLHFRYNSTGTDLYRQHQAHVCDLEPGTTYSYQVGGGGSWSSVYTFHTAPDIVAHPDAEVVLGFVGDSRGGYDVWAQLATQIQMRAPDLLLFSGDAVTVGLTQGEWDQWLDASSSLLTTTPAVLTNGNHEANAINLYAQFAMPGDGENFGFDYGFAHIFVANDSPDDVADLNGAIPTAMDADFTAHESARWKLLMHHRPMWSSGTRHGSDLMLQASWGPIVDKHHLDLVLNGHEHQYELSYPLAGGVVQATNATGTVYVVAGGAGADLYGFGMPGFWSQYIESVHTAAILHVRSSLLTLDSFRADGTAIAAGFSKTK